MPCPGLRVRGRDRGCPTRWRRGVRRGRASRPETGSAGTGSAWGQQHEHDHHDHDHSHDLDHHHDHDHGGTRVRYSCAVQVAEILEPVEPAGRWRELWSFWLVEVWSLLRSSLLQEAQRVNTQIKHKSCARTSSLRISNRVEKTNTSEQILLMSTRIRRSKHQ